MVGCKADAGMGEEIVNLLIVGKFTGTRITDREWELIGVFSSESLALAACEGHRLYFVVPAVLDVVQPDSTTDWVGAYYPFGNHITA